MSCDVTEERNIFLIFRAEAFSYSQERSLIYLYQGLHEDEETVKLDELAAQVRELGNKIEKTVPPKLRLANRLDDVREKYQSTKSEFEDVRKKAKSAKITFQQLKRQRRDMFMKCFEFVSQQERFESYLIPKEVLF